MDIKDKKIWQEIEEKLNKQGFIRLVVDEFKISLLLQIIGRKLKIMTYVNNEFKGLVMKNDCEETQRFMRKVSESLYSPKKQKEWVKNFGKKDAEKHGLFNKYDYYTPFWNNFKNLQRHFKKNNKEIRIA